MLASVDRYRSIGVVDMQYTDAVGAFMAHIDARDFSPKTIIGYRSDLERFRRFFERKYNLGWAVEETTPADIEEFLI